MSCESCGYGTGPVIRKIAAGIPPAWASGEQYRGSSWWTVTLGYQDRQMTTAFGTGPAGDEPGADDVMSCLLSDAAGWENADGFEDWAREYGFETGEEHDPDLDPGPDPGKPAREMYGRLEAEVGRLRGLLGDDYEKILWGE
jgi:hypothetical protein